MERTSSLDSLATTSAANSRTNRGRVVEGEGASVNLGSPLSHSGLLRMPSSLGSSRVGSPLSTPLRNGLPSYDPELISENESLRAENALLRGRVAFLQKEVDRLSLNEETRKAQTTKKAENEQQRKLDALLDRVNRLVLQNGGQPLEEAASPPLAAAQQTGSDFEIISHQAGGGAGGESEPQTPVDTGSDHNLDLTREQRLRRSDSLHAKQQIDQLQGLLANTRRESQNRASQVQDLELQNQELRGLLSTTQEKAQDFEKDRENLLRKVELLEARQEATEVGATSGGGGVGALVPPLRMGDIGANSSAQSQHYLDTDRSTFGDPATTTLSPAGGGGSGSRPSTTSGLGTARIVLTARGSGKQQQGAASSGGVAENRSNPLPSARIVGSSLAASTASTTTPGGNSHLQQITIRPDPKSSRAFTPSDMNSSNSTSSSTNLVTPRVSARFPATSSATGAGENGTQRLTLSFSSSSNNNQQQQATTPSGTQSGVSPSQHLSGNDLLVTPRASSSGAFYRDPSQRQ